MKKLLPLLAAVSVMSLSANSYAAMLIGFDPFGMPSGAKPNPFNASSSTGTISLGSNVQLNAGLTYGAGATSGGSANGWGGAGLNSVDLAAAVTANDYYTLTLQAAPGNNLSFSTINMNITRGAASATTFIWEYQIGGSGGFTAIGTSTDISGAIAKTPYSVDLSGVSALQNVTGSVELRFYAWGASSSSSSMFFGATTATGDYSALNFVGTVTSVPEPATWALLGFGGMVGFFFRRRSA